MTDKTIQLGWCLIPPYIMAREELSDCEKMVYGRIVGLVGNRGYCFASNAWLGHQIQKDDNTISHAISSLKAKGLIETQITRDDKSKIIERRIFVPTLLKSEIPLSEITNTPISEIGVDSVESKSVDFSGDKIEEKLQLQKQRHLKKGTPLGGSPRRDFPPTPVSSGKREVDATAVI